MTGTATLTAEDAYSLYADAVLSFARQYEDNLSLAEDFASEAWASAVKAWDRFDGRNPLGWLRTILKNVIRMHYRKKSSVCLSLEASITRVDRNGAFERSNAGLYETLPTSLIWYDDLDLSVARIDKSLVLDAYRQLHPRDCQVLALRANQVKDCEAALILGISQKAYNQRLFRARQHIKVLIIRSAEAPTSIN